MTKKTEKPEPTEQAVATTEATATALQATTQATRMARQATTVSSIPNLYAFDPQSSTWESYRDRVSFYFKANRITTDEDKKALFLWAVGDTVYTLLESLVAPASLTDENITFDNVIEYLNQHYDTTKNIMTATFDFYSCYQKPGQPFHEWKAELCNKMKHCGFTSSCLAKKPQDRALRDMYVMGIHNQKIRQALLKEVDPDLEKTEKIIQTAERLQADILHFDNPVKENGFPVAKIHNQHKQKRRQRANSNSSTKSDHKSCDSCGSTNHRRSDCKYREFICNFCKKKGHLERICRRKKESDSTNHISRIFKLKNTSTSGQSNIHPSTISLCMNGHTCTMEVDTGAMNTIIGIQDWHKIGCPTIRPSKLKLKCYSGSILKVKGECVVDVQYNNQSFNLPIVVVNFSTPSLLGLHGISQLKLDLNHVIHGPTNVSNVVHKIHDITEKPQRNKRTQWQPDVITKQITSMFSGVQSSDGQRHQNQLHTRLSSNNQLYEVDNLPDELFKYNCKANGCNLNQKHQQDIFVEIVNHLIVIQTWLQLRGEM